MAEFWDDTATGSTGYDAAMLDLYNAIAGTTYANVDAAQAGGVTRASLLTELNTQYEKLDFYDKSDILELSDKASQDLDGLQALEGISKKITTERKNEFEVAQARSHTFEKMLAPDFATDISGDLAEFMTKYNSGENKIDFSHLQYGYLQELDNKNSSSATPNADYTAIIKAAVLKKAADANSDTFIENNAQQTAALDLLTKYGNKDTAGNLTGDNAVQHNRISHVATFATDIDILAETKLDNAKDDHKEAQESLATTEALILIRDYYNQAGITDDIPVDNQIKIYDLMREAKKFLAEKTSSSTMTIDEEIRAWGGNCNFDDEEKIHKELRTKRGDVYEKINDHDGSFHYLATKQNHSTTEVKYSAYNKVGMVSKDQDGNPKSPEYDEILTIIKQAKKRGIESVTFGENMKTPEYKALLYIACQTQGLKITTSLSTQDIEDFKSIRPEIKQSIQNIEAKKKLNQNVTLAKAAYQADPSKKDDYDNSLKASMEFYLKNGSSDGPVKGSTETEAERVAKVTSRVNRTRDYDKPEEFITQRENETNSEFILRQRYVAGKLSEAKRDDPAKVVERQNRSQNINTVLKNHMGGRP